LLLLLFSSAEAAEVRRRCLDVGLCDEDEEEEEA
jgi:hypothetical protein